MSQRQLQAFDVHEPQGQDGLAHAAYFDKRRQVSFIYDGTRPYIDVSVGGYGEPVVARIEIEDFSVDTPVGLFWEAFEARCKRFIDEMFRYDIEAEA